MAPCPEKGQIFEGLSRLIRGNHPKHRSGPGRLVPVDLVDATTGQIRLGWTLAEFHTLQPAQEAQIVRGLDPTGQASTPQQVRWVAVGGGPSGVAGFARPIARDRGYRGDGSGKCPRRSGLPWCPTGGAGRFSRTSVTSAHTERWPSARATAMRWCPSST